MKAATILTILLVAAGVVMAIYAFMQNSAPYVTVSEAKRQPGRYVHIAVGLVPESIQADLTTRKVRFVVEDQQTGEKLNVVYDGFKPDNMEEAPTVVVGGAYQGDHFACNDILLKCPSKYESEVTGAET